MSWWIRPLVRIVAALLLPLVVPAAITGILWALPGDPASILCPEGVCSQEARDTLVEQWHLDSAPAFYANWLGNAAVGDFGASISAFTGMQVSGLLLESLPNTTLLLIVAIVPILLGTVLAALGWMPKRLDPVLQAVGIAPAVILALFCTAFVVINYGAFSYEGWPGTLRILLGGLVLGIADNALSGAVTGTRAVFETEMKQRYIGIAILRGESTLGNALPNVLPSLIGQFRGRLLHLLSGTVVVEVVLGIEGLGDLLWRGTLSQDFFIVLAAAWGFSLLSAVLLLGQAMAEVGVAMVVRRSPAVPA